MVIILSFSTKIPVTIGGGDENNLFCHEQETSNETIQLRYLGNMPYSSSSSGKPNFRINFCTAHSLQKCPELVHQTCKLEEGI